MKIKALLMALAAAGSIAPAFAGQGWDSTTVMRDYTLNNGAGSTGPGMSGYLHSGMQDRSLQSTSIQNGKSGTHRIGDGFSRRAVYNNDVSISLQHIR